MLRRSTTKINADFRKDIPEYSDKRIIEILKQRDHYQPEAAKLAIEEAIKRGIIFSEQDLFAEEYIVEELDTKLIPKIRKAKNKEKIRRSLARTLVLFGIMPLVFGFVQINSANQLEGVLILLAGLLWMYLSAQLIKQYQKLFIHVLLALSLLAIAYVYTKLILANGFVIFDFFLPGVLLGLLVYGLLFLKKLGD